MKLQIIIIYANIKFHYLDLQKKITSIIIINIIQKRRNGIKNQTLERQQTIKVTDKRRKFSKIQQKQ